MSVGQCLSDHLFTSACSGWTPQVCWPKRKWRPFRSGDRSGDLWEGVVWWLVVSCHTGVCAGTGDVPLKKLLLVPSLFLFQT